jgi:hypothetical protein
MRRLGAILLCLGLTSPLLAGPGEAPPADDPPSVPWYRWLFLGERAKPVPPKPAVVNKAPANTPLPKESAGRTLAEEQRVFLERLNAISQIKRVALEQGDEEMLKKAEDLEQQVEEVFKQRTARLPAGGDDRAALERGRDDRPATAARPAPRRPATRGGDR